MTTYTLGQFVDDLDAITAHQGTIDEFIGDAIFAVFGAHQKFARRNPRDVQQFKHLWWRDSV